MYGKILLSWWSQDRGKMMSHQVFRWNSLEKFKTTIIWKYYIDINFVYWFWKCWKIDPQLLILQSSQIKMIFLASFLILNFNILYSDRLWRSTCSCFKTKDIWARRGKYLQLCKTILCVWSCFLSFWLDYI